MKLTMNECEVSSFVKTKDLEILRFAQNDFLYVVAGPWPANLEFSVLDLWFL
jgi:hypothetical protein